MKKLVCLFKHKGLKVRDTICKKYENEDEVIKVWYCKYCGKYVALAKVCTKGKFNHSFNDKN